MKTFIVTTTALLLLTAAPAMAMSCCGGGKGAMCGKPGMEMGHGSMKKSKGGCCCENMSMNMSKRR
ncbi:hypothetical protein FV222_10740 [Methylobacterium sp. WL103]|uniref:hypothetical protein n=1 Tax=Methylobacterium sp. WL103 TaxID=2603891 RepID=UPI0011C721D6|nr:hypothetical protein [Methylobacterium sp. WL103]TXN01387.1 hypothetical protein FV222_10740 [Methylobacterium sp. WL103]